MCPYPKSSQDSQRILAKNPLQYNQIFVNGAFVGLCATTIFAVGLITISPFVSELQPLKRRRLFFLLKIVNRAHSGNLPVVC